MRVIWGNLEGDNPSRKEKKQEKKKVGLLGTNYQQWPHNLAISLPTEVQKPNTHNGKGLSIPGRQVS